MNNLNIKDVDNRFLNICRNCYNGFAGRECEFLFNLMSLPSDVIGDKAFERGMFDNYGMTSKEFQSYFNELMFDESANEEEKEKKLIHNITMLYNDCELFWFKGSMDERIMEEYSVEAIQAAKEAFENCKERLFCYVVGEIAIVLYDCDIIGCITNYDDFFDSNKMSSRIKELYDETDMLIVRSSSYFGGTPYLK